MSSFAILSCRCLVGGLVGGLDGGLVADKAFLEMGKASRTRPLCSETLCRWPVLQVCLVGVVFFETKAIRKKWFFSQKGGSWEGPLKRVSGKDTQQELRRISYKGFPKRVP